MKKVIILTLLTVGILWSIKTGIQLYLLNRLQKNVPAWVETTNLSVDLTCPVSLCFKGESIQLNLTDPPLRLTHIRVKIPPAFSIRLMIDRATLTFGPMSGQFTGTYQKNELDGQLTVTNLRKTINQIATQFNVSPWVSYLFSNEEQTVSLTTHQGWITINGLPIFPIK